MMLPFFGFSNYYFPSTSDAKPTDFTQTMHAISTTYGVRQLNEVTPHVPTDDTS
jgi:hypothetical protein